MEQCIKGHDLYRNNIYISSQGYVECKICRDLSRKRWNDNHPWAKSYSAAKYRCGQEQGYGKRGIRFEMTLKDFRELWFRDKAYLMIKPSIDRIVSSGDYTKPNCRFIEMLENTSRPKCGLGIRIEQCNREGVRLRVWDSAFEAGKKLAIARQSIWSTASGRRPTAGGFIWRYV